MTGAEVPKGAVLTTDSTVTCGHSPFGKVTLTGTAKLQIGGLPVLVAAGVGPGIGPGCLKVKQDDIPCASVTKLTGGLSKKLCAGSGPVVLASLAGTTNGVISTVTGALTVTKAQSKLVVGS